MIRGQKLAIVPNLRSKLGLLPTLRSKLGLKTDSCPQIKYPVNWIVPKPAI